MMILDALFLASRHGFSIDHGRATQLVVIEGTARRLIVREVRLTEDVAEIIILIGPAKNVPDVPVEPGFVIRVPAEPPGTPMNQRPLIGRSDMLRMVEGARH